MSLLVLNSTVSMQNFIKLAKKKNIISVINTEKKFKRKECFNTEKAEL